MPAPINEDVGFQRKMWRVGWTMLALVVVAALMGAFGDGVLSEVRASMLTILSRHRTCASSESRHLSPCAWKSGVPVEPSGR